MADIQIRELRRYIPQGWTWDVFCNYAGQWTTFKFRTDQHGSSLYLWDHRSQDWLPLQGPEMFDLPTNGKHKKRVKFIVYTRMARLIEEWEAALGAAETILAERK